jgi:YfiH family protein
MPPSASAPRHRAWDAQWIVPDWPAPPGVRALITTRAGGFSRGPFGTADGSGGLNLGLGSAPGLIAVAAPAQDDPAVVQRNRDRLRVGLPAMPRWLHQVHGSEVVDLDVTSADFAAVPQADAALTGNVGVVCCVLVADCLPVLLADAAGRGVAVAHAGWRGLAGGVIQNTVQALRRRIGAAAAPLLAYLGPAIGPVHFVVGPEVRSAMLQRLPQAERAFVPDEPGRFRADLFELARQALAQAGVQQVHGGGLCTVSEPGRFYSYRRDRVTGRHAALIWIEESGAADLP